MLPNILYSVALIPVVVTAAPVEGLAPRVKFHISEPRNACLVEVLPDDFVLPLVSLAG